jgi:hypothetical protein
MFRELRDDGIEDQSGDENEKLRTDAPPRANAQGVPYKIGLTEL